MPLSPTDVNAKEFKITRKGYHVDEVDAFLDEVEAELVRLLSDNAALRAQSAAPPAVAQPAAGVVPVISGGILAGETEGVALRTLLLAQQTADAAIAQARAEADAMVAQARNKLTEADDAVAAQVASVLGDLDERRRQLEQQIEDLRAFEREYRVRLKAYLEGQLRDLDGSGAADDAGAGVPVGARATIGGAAVPALTANTGSPVNAVSSAPAPALAGLIEPAEPLLNLTKPMSAQ